MIAGFRERAHRWSSGPVTRSVRPTRNPTAMTPDDIQTHPPAPEFDISRYPPDSLFHERRTGHDRRHPDAADEPELAPPRPDEATERRQKKERRRRIDPTTFEKQYTDDEMEFMNAMQRFKELSGKTFPSHGDVIKVAVMLGYRRAVFEFDQQSDDTDGTEPSIMLAATDPE